MATKPTKRQEQACDDLAEALLLITGAARLDGKSTFGKADVAEAAERMALASSAYKLDEIVARALARRVRALGLRAGTADLLLLIEGEIRPLEMLILPDDQFK